MPTNNLRRALNYGPTAAARFFVGLASTLQALRLFLGHVNWVSPEIAHFWGVCYALVAILLFWRLIDDHPNPMCGWVANIFVCLVWLAGLVLRAKLDASSLLTPYSTVTLMAVWCLLRTEATPLDTRDT